MTTRGEVIHYCKSFDNVIEDYPFHDNNWALMRHKLNKKTFACVYEHQNNIWINVKCDPEWKDFWRSAFTSIVPAYHMNKEHWNSIILDGTVRNNIKIGIRCSSGTKTGSTHGKINGRYCNEDSD